MVILKKTIMLVAMALVSVPAIAQEDAELAEKMLEAETRLAESTYEFRASEAQMRAQQLEHNSDEIEFRMKEAELRLAEAARHVADLSMAQLPRVERLERIIRANRGPMLGVTIGSDEDSDPVEGVSILGVSPGGAAEEAGLHAGDVITAINDVSLTADNSHEANSKLLDFMQGVEDGDSLNVEYLRNGKSDSTEITPRPMGSNFFAFEFNGGNFTSPDIHTASNGRQFSNFIWHLNDDGFGDMELAQLTERLGSYFGTAEGLLVVRAPEDEDLQLEDGDVILNIDGRKPKTIAHAMRILGSYESGEELKIEIMRDKRKRTITLEIPDNRQSANWPILAPRVEVKTKREIVIVEEDRT